MKKEIHLFRPVDLTKGTPWKVMLLFALPILISTLLGNAFSLINALVLKNTVGGDSVTAINSTGNISAILFNFAYGCSGGFSVIASNKFGEKNQTDLKKVFYTSTILCIILAVIITVIGLIVYPYLLRILNIDAAYIDRAGAYFQIILFSFIFMMLNNMFGNFLRALGDSLAPLILSFLATLINIGFAFFFTGFIRLDTRGVAIATLIANLANAVVTLLYIYHKYPHLRAKKGDFRLDKGLTKDCLKLGLPLGLQWSILFIGSFVQASEINKFGHGMATKAVGCYGAFEGYLTIPLGVMSSALLSFVGQNYGAKQKTRIKQGIKQALIIDLLCYALILIIGFIAIPYVPYIFLPANEVNDPVLGPQIMYYCSTYLYVMTPFLILQGILQLSRSALQGICKPLIPFLSGAGELIARVAICLFIPAFINPTNPLSDASYLGICFSTPIAWLASVLIMGGSVYYFVFKKNLPSLPDEILNIENAK